jgi:hypothetical protein
MTGSGCTAEALTIAGDASARWTALLDAMEVGLELSPPVPVRTLPADPGPLPPALHDRATELLRRMAEAEAELAGRQAEVARQLTGLSAARTASGNAGDRNVPRFLDARA